MGLIICYAAGHRREREQGHEVKTDFKPYVIGVVAACVAGLFSAGQNIMFSLTAPVKDLALQHGYTKLAASLIDWPYFLLFAFIPYAIYMIYPYDKTKTTVYIAELCM